MKEVLYAVIILNYNTIDDAIAAYESVKKNATTSQYVVCIADNASTKEYDRKKCKTLSEDNVITVCLDKNDGYAQGNNQAILFVKKNYNPKYYVIMNPDVLVINCGTIENMIDRMEQCGGNIVGGQPLVWNCFYGDDARMQQNIRQVPSFTDLCMLSNLALKALLRKRYRKSTYSDSKPYQEEIRYRVPSGAFFAIDAEVFEKIGLFDPNTFLYYEEHIIGKKLEKIDKELLFMPQFLVRHEHGKSTGNNHYSINWFARKCGQDAKNYYATEYLNCNRARILLLNILSTLDIPLQYIRMQISRIQNK